MEKIKNKIFNIKNDKEFNDIAVEIFNYQYKNNIVYSEFTNLMNVDVKKVVHYTDIPFLPIEFFKTHNVVCLRDRSSLYFESSGTTGIEKSRHYIYDEKIYITSLLKSFELFYGKPEKYYFFALTPSASDNPKSSLAFMINQLIRRSNFNESGFYLGGEEKMLGIIENIKLKQNKARIVIFGLTYALLDLSEACNFNFSDIIFIETGGIKGKRKEYTKKETHDLMKKAFNVKNIHSEYSMTEVLSQAYSKSDGVFFTPPWMKILVRDPNDFSCYYGSNKQGGVNIIDLANLYSCSFISTQDLGKNNDNGSFEVLGRFDHSDLRGCNLMYQQ